MVDNIDLLRQDLIDLIYAELGGDSQFDREGGQFPNRDRAEEIVDDGILALAKKYDALKLYP
uniref:Uncharacterized protein n=1 Tax=viral metagenome TaxID=1070528 RepID=A0A6M3K3J1_9ZZZZ